jgi:hypothetical protein
MGGTITSGGLSRAAYYGTLAAEQLTINSDTYTDQVFSDNVPTTYPNYSPLTNYLRITDHLLTIFTVDIVQLVQHRCQTNKVFSVSRSLPTTLSRMPLLHTICI